jgi:rhomboid family GlyGly-CTERM serine protease
MSSTAASINPSMPGFINRPVRLPLDLVAFGLLLVLGNAHLLGAPTQGALIFLPSAVADGQWWRLFTYPFVHASAYHLALDAGAFFLLYTGLSDRRPGRRLLSLTICNAFSLGTVVLTTPAVETLGLSGLSGVGHGLMALSALEMAASDRGTDDRRIGIACLTLTVAKSIYEAVTGNVFFDFGLCGIPLAFSHAGGVLGGIAAWLIWRGIDRYRTDSKDGFR